MHALPGLGDCLRCPQLIQIAAAMDPVALGHRVWCSAERGGVVMEMSRAVMEQVMDNHFRFEAFENMEALLEHCDGRHLA